MKNQAIYLAFVLFSCLNQAVLADEAVPDLKNEMVLQAVAPKAPVKIVIPEGTDPKEVLKAADKYAKQAKLQHKKGDWKIVHWAKKQETAHPRFWRVMRTRVVPASQFTASALSAGFSIAGALK